MIMSHKPPETHEVLMISPFLSGATYTTLSASRGLLFNALHSPASWPPPNIVVNQRSGALFCISRTDRYITLTETPMNPPVPPAL